MNLVTGIGLLSAVATMTATGNAVAQISADAPESAGTPQAPAGWRPLSGFGMTLAGGAGVSDFTQSSTRAVTDVGGSWAVRFAFETRRLLGFEVSYVGAANTIHSLGFDHNGMLVRNGIEGAVRLNVPLYARGTLLEPYMAGGVGWNAYHITSVSGATSDADPAPQNTLSVPLAFGFVFGYRGFIADARYTIRPTYKQSTLHDDGSGALTNWDVGGMLGYEF